MEKAPALDPMAMPLYESCIVAFYRGAPAPGAPVVPTPLITNMQVSISNSKHNVTQIIIITKWAVTITVHTLTRVSTHKNKVSLITFFNIRARLSY